MPKKDFSVKEKESHYRAALSDKSDPTTAVKGALRQSNYTGFAAGYLRAVADCRKALSDTKKK